MIISVVFRCDYVFTNSYSAEIELLATPRIIYCTIGGVIDLYFFLGPNLENVVQQYMHWGKREREMSYIKSGRECNVDLLMFLNWGCVSIVNPLMGIYVVVLVSFALMD